MAEECKSSSGKRCFIGGNWKCNGTRESVAALVDVLNRGGSFPPNAEVVVAPTALHIGDVFSSIRTDVAVAAQNVWREKGFGAFTGELTASMIKDYGLKWTIVGHSERRKDHGESNELAALKAKTALEEGLSVIFCIGEKLEDREAGKTEDVVLAQLAPLLAAASTEQWGRLVVAYEPVWAIGTGKVATPGQAQAVHKVIRGKVAQVAGPAVAAALRIIYGGSVKAKNCSSLISEADIDGFLVGGASLKPQFLDIIGCVRSRL